MAQQSQSEPRVRSTAPGIGFGVKAGVLFSSFRDARSDYKSRNGWQGGLFIGGNRAGALGVQTEINYAKKGSKSGSLATDTYYLEIPLLLRMNVGSSNRNAGVNVYAFGGPAADILLKAQLDGVDIKRQFKDLDWNVIAGVGVEVSRILVEGRFNWGLANVLDGPGNELKTQSFAVLGGIRLN
ncbi:MAG TPA: porin family protein [Vicinamibacterales bacterium]|nr:porin family protein [Vicinamibacterales bacterium]